ncbi:phosphatase 2C family protein [Medicago truncatula]|uniref:Phosphatase 2C family protein n=1 Tax=Medicago truncatula TaxID=3880 RepID=G7KYY9_MEDTR|nr:phosphatase 2C family protein [Medicago truncatula]
MGEHLDIVSIGSCVLILLLHGNDLYTLNLGDRRAVLATCSEKVNAIRLTDSHTVDNEAERLPEKVYGICHKKNLNDALMEILRVCNLSSPPYISSQPSLNVHKISNSDQFVIVGSDGLFDFFSNEEAVKLVESCILNNPFGDPARLLWVVLMSKALAGYNMEVLMNVPDMRRRKYHDHVTVIVIMLGMNKRNGWAKISKNCS